jgi:hypothetical protein
MIANIMLQMVDEFGIVGDSTSGTVTISPEMMELLAELETESEDE